MPKFHGAIALKRQHAVSVAAITPRHSIEINQPAECSQNKDHLHYLGGYCYE
jgi:hypothetical protein